MKFGCRHHFLVLWFFSCRKVWSFCLCAVVLTEDVIYSKMSLCVQSELSRPLLCQSTVLVPAITALFLTPVLVPAALQWTSRTILAAGELTMLPFIKTAKIPLLLQAIGMVCAVTALHEHATWCIKSRVCHDSSVGSESVNLNAGRYGSFQHCCSSDLRQ